MDRAQRTERPLPLTARPALRSVSRRFWRREACSTLRPMAAPGWAGGWPLQWKTEDGGFQLPTCDRPRQIDRITACPRPRRGTVGFSRRYVEPGYHHSGPRRASAGRTGGLGMEVGAVGSGFQRCRWSGQVAWKDLPLGPAGLGTGTLRVLHCWMYNVLTPHVQYGGGTSRF